MELSWFLLTNYENALISVVCGVTKWHCLIFHHLGPCCRSCQELHLCLPHEVIWFAAYPNKVQYSGAAVPVCDLLPLFSPYHKWGEEREPLHLFHLSVILHFRGTYTPLCLLHGWVCRHCMWYTCDSHSGITNLHIKNIIVRFPGQRVWLL